MALFGLVLIGLIAALVAPVPAHAYLDPGSSSFIFQVAIASGLGLLFAFRNFWSRFKSLFTGRSKDTAPHNVQAKNPNRK